MRILIVAGARPNFVKIAPILREIRRYPSLEPRLVHTGQHYDEALSDRLFSDLEIPTPNANLGVGSGSHAVQTAEIPRRVEPVLVAEHPDMVVVVGDVNSTLAAALAAVKLGIRVAHVEAGLRSGDRSMPEEINRVLVDAISDLLFVTEASGYQNLLHEGIDDAKIHFVGNVMVDALLMCRDRWERSTVRESLGLPDRRRYAMLTLHRPSNVDSPVTLARILEALRTVGREFPIIWPVHPRTRPRLVDQKDLIWPDRASGKELPPSGIICIEPLGYLDCIALMNGARLVMTDSGGVQEEATMLGVPCLTLRDTTERPVTIKRGTNCLTGTDPVRIVQAALHALRNVPAVPAAPPLWDGRSAARIVRILASQARNLGQHEDAA